MKTSAITGIIFANANENMLKQLTENRSMASVPFGSRYRLIDFSLSSLVNAGVWNVGIITKENYRSLMDHVGNGVAWDLDRKNGGLHILPPYFTKGVKRYNGTVDALNGALDFIEKSKSKYLVLCNAYTIANVDIAAAVKAHKQKEADITIVYHNGILPEQMDGTMVIKTDADQRITEMSFDKGGEKADFGIGITIVNKDLLVKLVKEAEDNELDGFAKDVIASKLKALKIYGFEHKEFVAVMDSTSSYYNANMALLNKEERQQLFNRERPILTKTRDDMPTRYGTKSNVTNSLLGDGCIIEGTVKNSILFRGVKVEKGAVVENCILMQETTVSQNTVLENVISDKNAVIGEGMVLKGTQENYFFIKKQQIV